MATTTNYSLMKPNNNDYYNIADFNNNADIIDSALTPTADPTQVPTGVIGKLSQWVSWLTNRIKAITGKTNWYDPPDITLADTKSHIDDPAIHFSLGGSASIIGTTSSGGAANTASRTDHVHALQTVTTSENTSSSSPADGSSFIVIDSITIDSFGRTTAKNTKTVTLPSARTAVLTGLSTAANAVITAADNVLTAFGKLQAQISAIFTSPSFTGTPVAPTAALGTNTTQIATTAFVLANTVPKTAASTTGNFDTTTTAPTATNRLNYNGYLYATRVYGAVYNDYAEYFEKGEKAEPGDLLEIDEDTYIKSSKPYSNKVVGVVSDSYSHCIGGKGNGHDDENYLPVGLSGRVKAKVKGSIKEGDLIVSSGIPGVGMASDEYRPGTVVGKALEKHMGEGIDRILILIMNI